MAQTATIDILMITHRRPSYTKRSLSRLFDTCDSRMRVWIWQNGTDQETIDVVSSFRNHPSFYNYHHSLENKQLNEPTNWLWSKSDADYFSKVDDDCIMPYGWAQTLINAYKDIPDLGVIGCWRFPEEDFLPELATQKITSHPGGHKIMRNCWIEGSGYLMNRTCYDLLGPLKPQQSFPKYCINISKRGFIIGWYYPFLYQEHLDDPRSSHSLLRTDNDMQQWAPLSAIRNGIATIEEWQQQLKESATYLQSASYDVKYYTGYRHLLRRGYDKLKSLITRIIQS